MMWPACPSLPAAASAGALFSRLLHGSYWLSVSSSLAWCCLRWSGSFLRLASFPEVLGLASFVYDVLLLRKFALIEVVRNVYPTFFHISHHLTVRFLMSFSVGY